MDRIAFFSDDDAGALCAQLVALGLARLGLPLTLALQPRLAREAAGVGLPAEISVVALAERANGFDVEQALREASRSGGDIVAALPLSAAGDIALRRQFDAAITVGSSPAAAARAMRAARYDAGSDGSARAGSRARLPAWFLARSDQAVLATKARLSSVAGPALPFATRTLPAVLPRSLVASRGYFGDAMPDVVGGTAVLLAALSLAVAADPWARQLDAAGLVGLMSARTLPAERALSDRLVGLANAYESLLGATGADWGADDLAASPSRPRDRRAPAVRAVPVDRNAAALPSRRAYRA